MADAPNHDSTRPKGNTDGSPSGETALREYWNGVSQRFAAGDPLAAVCHPGTPAWYNRFLASLQWRAVTRSLRGVPLSGRKTLDVGCGYGRWTRWLASQGAEVIGVDPTAALLDAAHRASPEVDYRCMSATELDFPDASFDLVVCVTVLQHLKPAEQEVAIAELCRVTRPGGILLVLDLVDPFDRGNVVYPRPAEQWIASYAAHGASLEAIRGEEFVPLIRVSRWIVEGIARLIGIWKPREESLVEQTRERVAFRPVYAGLWCMMQLSRPLERACEALLPPGWARHCCFVFRKADTDDLERGQVPEQQRSE